MLIVPQIINIKMANTYTQLYFHVVFAVKGRDNYISSNWKEELYKYIAGIITNKNQKLIIINGMPNHLHILLGTKPDCNLSDLIRDIIPILFYNVVLDRYEI